MRHRSTVAALAAFLAVLNITRAQPYSENFNDNLAQNWVVASGDGTWPALSGNIYTQTANIMEAISTYSTTTWNTNYTYNARVRTTWTGSGNRVGVIFNYVSAQDYAYVLISAAGGVQLGRIDANNPYGDADNGYIVANGTYTGGGSNVWVTVEVVRNGTNTTVRINGTNVTGMVNIAQTTLGTGRVGLMSNWNSTAAFDDVNLLVPEVNVTGNATAIVDGDTSPSTGDYTDFGSVNVASGSLSRAFTIQNTGTAALTIGSVTKSGGQATDFAITQPITTTIAAGQSTTFSVLFDPSASGLRTASLSFTNNDTNGISESPYNFNIQGTGISDTTPPTVSLTAPADGSTVSGTVVVDAIASDNVGVVGVQFKLNGGTNLGAEDTVSPYGISWDTITATNAQHVITAVARDAAGNSTTSAGRLVTVNNGGYKTTFPRLAGAQIGSKDYNVASYQAHIAKLDVAILGFYKGWTGVGSPTMTIQQCVQQIKLMNPNIKVGNYTIFEAKQFSGAAWQDVWTKLNSGTGPTGNGGTWTPNDWWARTNTGAEIVKPDPYLWVTNCTDFVTPDSTGKRYPQWFAEWCNTEFFAPVPEFDIWYMDNFFWKPRYNADWDRNGVNDDQNSPTVQTYFRQGNISSVNAIGALQPGKVVMGNVDGGMHIPGGHLMEAQYSQLIGASLFESAMGASWSEEAGAWGGWYNMMAAYRSQLQNTKAPRLVMLTLATTADGKCGYVPFQSRYGNGNSYAFMRYALTSVLMDDGYAAFHAGGYSSSNNVWFDEFDRAGAATTGWLGTAIDPPQTTAYQNGVFRRRFQNGMAIVNPRTNPDKSVRAAQTITPESGYKRFLGSPTQDQATNNGANVTSITIQPGDGIILMSQ